MAIKCHSGFVHYNMFHNHHCHGGGNNYGSIFNIKHNCGGGTNFWGGLGAGLGFGLSGMFSGLFGGIGNMFGGFGLGNMFGGLGNMFGGFGGFGMGGFGSPFGGGWGSGWGDGLSELFGGKNKTDKSDKSDKETKTVTDIDNGKINDLVAKGDKLIAEAKNADKSKEIQELLDEIDDKYKKDNEYKFEDEINTSDNKKQLELLIERLKAAKATEVDADPVDTTGTRAGDEADADPVDTTGSRAGAEASADPVDTTGTRAGADDNNAPKVTINGKDIPLTDLTPDNIKALTKEQIDGLQADQAKALLDKLGLLCKDNSGRDSVKATTSLNALRLAEKAGLPVALAHNKALDNKQGTNVDPYLDGMVSKIEYNETTQIITYHLEDENGIYKVECKAGSTEIETKELIKNKTQKYKSFTTATYKIKTDDGPYAVRDGLPPSASAIEK